MFDKLSGAEERQQELERLLADPKVLQDRAAYQAYSREHADLTDIVGAYREFKQIVGELDESKELLKDGDSEIKDLAREEVTRLTAEKEALEQKMKQLLVPKDPLDGKNVLLEIRAGTGGEEAGLFAGDLFGMYLRYAEKQCWKIGSCDK